jgi:hypothetical protein
MAKVKNLYPLDFSLEPSFVLAAFLQLMVNTLRLF